MYCFGCAPREGQGGSHVEEEAEGVCSGIGQRRRPGEEAWSGQGGSGGLSANQRTWEQAKKEAEIQIHKFYHFRLAIHNLSKPTQMCEKSCSKAALK